MKVAIISGLDVNQQGSLMADWISKNTPHTAKNIISTPTFLDYPLRANDIALWKPENKDYQIKWEEYDFYILRWIPDASGWPSPEPIINWIKQGVLNKKNCLVKIHGSDARYNSYKWLGFWLRYGITMVTNGYDWTLCKDLGYSIGHIPVMCDTMLLEHMAEYAEMRNDGKFWIAHSATDPAKKNTAVLVSAVKRLQEQGVPVDVDVIMQAPYEESIKRKASCHAAFDQFPTENISSFGLSAIEALAMSKVCFAKYSNFVYSHYSEMRRYIEHRIDTDDLATWIKDRMKTLDWPHDHLFNPGGQRFARNNFGLDAVCEKWIYLIEHLLEA